MSFGDFERIVRIAHAFTEGAAGDGSAVHPFDERNIHADLPPETRGLFDNGHYSQATFEAFKFVDEEVARISRGSLFGRRLMQTVFKGNPPSLRLNPCMTLSEKNEQEGYALIFEGAIVGIRNPRGHRTRVPDDPDTCLDHLVLASMLLRKLEEAGLR